MRVESSLENDGLEVMIATLCLEFKTFPSEILNKNISEIYKIYAYIKYNNERQKELIEQKKENTGFN